MEKLVATSTQGDEVLLGIISQFAARLNVVYLEISEASTPLASPPITLEHLLAQSFVGFWVKP